MNRKCRVPREKFHSNKKPLAGQFYGKQAVFYEALQRNRIQSLEEKLYW